MHADARASMWSAAPQPGCSAPCVDPSGLRRWADDALTALLSVGEKVPPSEMRHVRNRWNRTGREGWVCGRDGRFTSDADLPCHHLPTQLRGGLGVLLQSLGYRGASAEVGVWHGDNSLRLLHFWKRGGPHRLVDPFRAFPCASSMADGKHVRPDKQCMFMQTDFDRTYNATRHAFRRHQGRVVFDRRFSVEAARGVPNASLDFVYIDARHDEEGVTADLEAWWPTLCPGGLFAGHDMDKGWPGVVRAVSKFAVRQRAINFAITAEHPGSWLFFRAPRPCTSPA